MSRRKFGKAWWGEVEINAALIAMAAAGGTVLLPVGTYHIPAPIIISSNVRLEGVGAGAIIPAIGECRPLVSAWFGEGL